MPRFLRMMFLFHQRHRHIVDIGSGGPCNDKSAHVLQGMIGVVVLQGVEYVSSLFCQYAKAVSVHIAACGISRAVSTVAAH